MMKQHLLSTISERKNELESLHTYYDFNSQISYLDDECVYNVT